MPTVPFLGSYGDISGSGLMFRNKIINASCLTDQRGSLPVQNNAVKYGGCDRFFVSPTGFTTVTSGQISKSAFSASTSGFGQWVSGFTCTGSGQITIGQRIEALNTIDLNNKTVTFSGIVYQDTGSSVTLNVKLNKANATDNFASVTQLGTTEIVTVPNNLATSFSLTVNLGSSDASNGLSCEVTFTGLGALTSKNFAIGNFQLESGAQRSPLEVRPIGLELALCQRYYWRFGHYTIYGSLPMFIWPVTNRYAVFLSHPTMRALPSVSHNLTDANYVAGSAVTGSQWNLFVQGSAFAAKTGTVTISSSPGVSGSFLEFSSATFSAAGLFNAGPTAYIEVFSEL